MKIFKFSAIPIILLFLLFLGNCKNPENDSNSPASMYGRFLLRLGLTQTLANTSYNVTALPSQVTVSIPRSIRKSTTTLSSVLEPRIMRQTTETQLAKAKGYQNLIDIVDKMYGLLGQTKLELILLNEVLQEAKNSPNTCFTGGTKSLKITQEMINSIKQSFMDYGLTSAQAETELLKQQESGKLPKLGESIPSPAVLYRSISETDTDTRLKKDYELGYRHIVQYYTSDKPSNTVTCPASDSGYNKVMKYDAAFQNIFYSVKADLEVPGLTIGIVASIALSKATSTDANSRDTMIFNMVTREKRGSKYTTTIDKNTITKCKQDANDSCIKIDSDTIQKDPSITSRDYDLKISVNGKINDSGGFILTEIHDVIFGDKVVDASGTTTTKVQKRYIKELFDSSGNLLGLEEGTDGRTFKPVEGFAKIDMTGGNVLDIFGEKFDGFGMGSAGGRVFIGFSTGPEGIGLNNVESDQFIIYQALSTTDAPSGYNDPSIVGEGE
ncbi:MAG: hypothetical protein KDK45_13360, partial [Leptospiraceae bacterium]|nr:hypothetical protein [Leptospiraceae bacterium]